MQITDLYQTKIEASTYNASIDSTDTVITVTLLDFNGNPVTGKNVTLTCDKGYFNKKGSTTISGTSTQSITLSSDSAGKITATYTASEWGLVTFSANTNKIQVKIDGWRKYNPTNFDETNYQVYYNDKFVNVIVHTGSANLSTSWKGWHNILTDDWIKPAMPVSVFDATGDVIIKCSDNSAQIVFRTVTGSKTGSVYGSLLWKIK